MSALIGFLLTIIIVVTVHEFGHYLAARCLRLRVLRFSVGFGSPLWSRTDKHGTEWMLAPIPLGGYVQMLQEDEAKERGLPLRETLESRPPWQRIVVFAAGPLANFILAALLYAGMSMAGERHMRPVVGGVAAESPAALAGLRAGDRIALVNNRAVHSWREVWPHLVDAAAEGEAVELRTATGAHRLFPAGSLSLDALGRGLRGVGVRRDFTYMIPKIAHVDPGTPAERAGLRKGDLVVMANEVMVETFEDFHEQVMLNPNRVITLFLWRDGAPVETAARPAADEDGYGRIGILPAVDERKYAALFHTVRLDAPAALAAAVKQVAGEVARVFRFLWLLVTFQLSAEHLSGPVGIANQAGTAADRGILPFLHFLAFISVNLGAINLAPLPLLDGGQILLCVLQSVRRRPLSDRARSLLERFGVALIVGLMTFVIINDLLKLW